MSTCKRCDWCGTALPIDAEEVRNWLTVKWGEAGNLSGSQVADYCTTACAVAGLEKARDDDAETLMTFADEDD